MLAGGFFDFFFRILKRRQIIWFGHASAQGVTAFLVSLGVVLSR